MTYTKYIITADRNKVDEFLTLTPLTDTQAADALKHWAKERSVSTTGLKIFTEQKGKTNE